MPDPDGRIAYAPITRFDPLFGPIAGELRAIDPTADPCTMAADGSDVVPLVASDSTFDNHPAWGVAAPGA